MSTYRNVNRFSSDVPETIHDGHQVAVVGSFRPLDPHEPGNQGAVVDCLTCPGRPRSLAFEEEVHDDDEADEADRIAGEREAADEDLAWKQGCGPT